MKYSSLRQDRLPPPPRPPPPPKLTPKPQLNPKLLPRDIEHLLSYARDHSPAGRRLGFWAAPNLLVSQSMLPARQTRDKRAINHSTARRTSKKKSAARLVVGTGAGQRKVGGYWSQEGWGGGGGGGGAERPGGCAPRYHVPTAGGAVNGRP